VYSSFRSRIHSILSEERYGSSGPLVLVRYLSRSSPQVVSLLSFALYESHLIVKRLQSITNENSDSIKRVDSGSGPCALLSFFNFLDGDIHMNQSGDDLFHIENGRSATFVPFDGC
jgi:hypothetical protein